MYQAILATVKVTPIPGAQNIAAGECCGYSVIVSNKTRSGELGVYFPTGGQLSHEMAMANDLYAKHPETGAPMGGHLEANRRIRTKRFMGIQAEGLWLPLESLMWCFDEAPADGSYCPTRKATDKAAIACLKFCGDKGPGFTFEGKINDRFVCQRYTPRMTARQAATAAGGKTRQGDIDGFPKHFDTAQLRMNLGQIKIGDRLILSEKLHGTSGRTCKLEVPISLPRWKQIANRVAHAFGFDGFATSEIKAYSGTRNCIVQTGATGEKGMKYREAAHAMIAPLLAIGEVVYYEIVGFGDDGKPIMPPHPVPEKMRKQLGDQQVYSYGCHPPLPVDSIRPMAVLVSGGELTENAVRRLEEFVAAKDSDRKTILLETIPTGAKVEIKDLCGPQFRIFVYRITQDGVDLTQDQLEKRCKVLGLEVCPSILSYTYDGHGEALMEICKAVCDGKGGSLDWSNIPQCVTLLPGGLTSLRNLTVKSSLDDRHIREGVCIRIERAVWTETADQSKAFVISPNDKMRFVTTMKYKGWLFCHLEDIRPNTDEAIDPEELEAQLGIEEMQAEIDRQDQVKREVREMTKKHGV
jgi:hypothetical protein